MVRCKDDAAWYYDTGIVWTLVKKETAVDYEKEYKKPAFKKFLRYAAFLVGTVLVIALLYWIY